MISSIFLIKRKGVKRGEKCQILNGVQGVGGSNPLAPTKNGIKAGKAYGLPAFLLFALESNTAF
jgi:hypothetical protein